MFLDDIDSLELGNSGVLLYSGGADSTLLAHALIRRGKRLIALSIDYPGRPAVEAERAARIAAKLGFSEHLTIELGLPWRALRGKPDSANEGWFPHRNLMFLAIARHVAEIRNANFVTAGYARTDGIVFTDATPDFLRLFDSVAGLSGQSASDRVDFLVPFLEKGEFFAAERARSPEVAALIAETWSCWRNGKEPCGVCAACRERAYYFEAAAVEPVAGIP